MQIDRLESLLGYTLIEHEGCWLFSGPTQNNFHGRAYYEGKYWQAHRLAYKLTYGSIPEGKFVLHKCDVGFCVNPNHLFIGTQQDNVADMIAKGRARFSCIGINNGRATLTENQVREIRELHSRGISNLELVNKFNTTENVISKIVTYRTWRHI